MTPIPGSMGESGNVSTKRDQLIVPFACYSRNRIALMSHLDKTFSTVNGYGREKVGDFVAHVLLGWRSGPGKVNVATCVFNLCGIVYAYIDWHTQVHVLSRR
jgi:hypothetical protein